jgi:hypothetical protein
MYYLFWWHNHRQKFCTFETYQNAVGLAQALIDHASGSPDCIEWHGDNDLVLRFKEYGR